MSPKKNSEEKNWTLSQREVEGCQDLWRKRSRINIIFNIFYFSSGQPENYTNSFSWRHWLFTIDCLRTTADRNIHFGNTEKVSWCNQEKILWITGLPQTIFSRDALGQWFSTLTAQCNNQGNLKKNKKQ